MPTDVNVAEYVEVPRAQSGGQTFGVLQIFGPLIKARDLTVDGTRAYELQISTRYVSVYNHGATTVYVATSTTGGTPLAQGHGKPVGEAEDKTIAARQLHRWLLLAERT